MGKFNFRKGHPFVTVREVIVKGTWRILEAEIAPPIVRSSGADFAEAKACATN